MTNELEKQFFDTFGIEPIVIAGCTIMRCINQHISNCTGNACPFYNKGKTQYPQITDRILLELICIAHTSPVITFCSRNVVSLKEEILSVLCNYINTRDIKHQVRTLFEEG